MSVIGETPPPRVAGCHGTTVVTAAEAPFMQTAVLINCGLWEGEVKSHKPWALFSTGNQGAGGGLGRSGHDRQSGGLGPW